MCEKEINRRGETCSKRIDHTWRSHFPQRQQKLKGNRDVGRIIEAAVLKINDASEIRELYWVIVENPETEKERNANERQEAEVDWEAMGEFLR